MEVYPVVVGDLKGSMDRTVFYKVEDRCFGRKKNQPKEREFSNEEQEHHLKFGLWDVWQDGCVMCCGSVCGISRSI